MSSGGGGDDGKSPTDIITYIGVPLAVLGVLPILYNTFLTLVNVSKIKRILRHSRLTALTRSDIVNRVIEIELPRYAVTPWDRFQHQSEYWSLSRSPSSIPGGSWTTFNWRTNVIGIKTQRVEYADQLRQPQVDVAFDELISYLLDLGAAPEPQGWKLLRSTGLWTPLGTALMTSPDGREKALTVAPLDDSDGNLSLAVSWSSNWTTRDHSNLPPYWVRLPPPLDRKAEEVAESSNPVVSTPENESANGDGASIAKKSIGSVEQEGQAIARKPITCHVSVDGLVTALAQDDDLQSTTQLDSLYVEHLKIRRGEMQGVWFASAITAFGTTSQTILWNYKIPDDLLTFARKETVPCGVLVLLGIVDEADTPQWATKYDDHGANLDRFARRSRATQAAVAAEARMTPAERAHASMERMRRENEDRLQEMRDQTRLTNQRREVRQTEALNSPKWDAKMVARHSLSWLQGRAEVPEGLTVKDAVGELLHRMVLDGQFTTSICRLLGLWRGWAEIGGMKKADFHALQDETVPFALATLLVAVINDTSTALEGTLSTDLQDCLRMWKRVRLGSLELSRRSASVSLFEIPQSRFQRPIGSRNFHSPKPLAPLTPRYSSADSPARPSVPPLSSVIAPITRQQSSATNNNTTSTSTSTSTNTNTNTNVNAMAEGEPTGLIATKGIELLTFSTPNGYKASVLLEELKEAYGLDYTWQSVNITKGTQKQAWFTAVSPNGRIPAVVDHDRGGFPVFEGLAILHYLTKHYDPEHRFSFPYDSDDYSVAEQWMAWQHGGLGPMQGQAGIFVRFAPEKIPYGIQRYVGEAERLYGILDARLSGGRDYVAGAGRGKYSIADMAILGWANGPRAAGIDRARFPNVEAWFRRCTSRPATKRGLEIPVASAFSNAAIEQKIAEGDRETIEKDEATRKLVEDAKKQYNYQYKSP